MDQDYEIVIGVPLTLYFGPKAIYSKDLTPQDFMKSLDICLESDIVMQKCADHNIKCDIEVHVPFGYIARVFTHEQALQEKGLSVIGEFIHHRSPNKKLRFLLRNGPTDNLCLKKGDIVGTLRLYKCPIEPVSFNISSISSN